MEYFKNYYRVEELREDGTWRDVAHYTNRKIAKRMADELRDSTDKAERRVIYVKEYSLDWKDNGIIL